MTNGILGIIACPMLEDELVYDMANDPEAKDVYVLESENTDAFRRKLRNKGVAFTDLDEWDFMHTDSMFDRSRFTVVIRMKSLGLHSEPAKLKSALQDDLVMLQGRVDAAAMYYGMCGNYGWDLTKWAEGHVDFPVEVFRDCQGRVCDDCIGVAVAASTGTTG